MCILFFTRIFCSVIFYHNSVLFLAPVGLKMVNAIHWIVQLVFPNTYLLDTDGE